MATKVTNDKIEYSFFKWLVRYVKKTLFTKYETFELGLPAWISFYVIHNGKKKRLTFRFEARYKTDGLSIPWFLRWFLKYWDEENDLYNLAAVVHDSLYGHKGFGIFNREDCDAIFRGLLREAGKDRFHASAADYFLEKFGGAHWGDDDLHCNDLVSMLVEE